MPVSGGRASSALPSMCKTLSQLDTGSEGLSKKSQTQFVCEVPTLSCLKGREGPKNTHIQFTALNTNIPGCYGVCSTCRWARVCVCVCVCVSVFTCFCVGQPIFLFFWDEAQCNLQCQHGDWAGGLPKHRNHPRHHFFIWDGALCNQPCQHGDWAGGLPQSTKASNHPRHLFSFGMRRCAISGTNTVTGRVGRQSVTCTSCLATFFGKLR